MKKNEKKCSKCEVIKNFNEFSKSKKMKCRLKSACKECNNEKNKKHYQNNKEKIKITKAEYFKKNNKKINKQHKKYYENNKGEILIRNKKNYQKNKEKFLKVHKIYYKKNKKEIRKNVKIWRENNKEIIAINGKEYREKNKEKIKKYNQQPRVKEKRNRRQRERINNNPHLKIKENLRGRIWKALKRGDKSASTIDLLGCSIEFFMNYIESLLTEGMSWENYGEWHIDHIKPCALFNLSKPSEQRKCFHYSNLQPLWAFENISKGAKY